MHAREQYYNTIFYHCIRHYIAVLICIADPYSRSIELSRSTQTVATFASLASPSYAIQRSLANFTMHVISLIPQAFLVCTWHTVGVVHSADIKFGNLATITD